jgi:hypothetical protein
MCLWLAANECFGGRGLMQEPLRAGGPRGGDTGCTGNYLCERNKGRPSGGTGGCSNEILAAKKPFQIAYMPQICGFWTGAVLPASAGALAVDAIYIASRAAASAMISTTSTGATRARQAATSTVWGGSMKDQSEAAALAHAARAGPRLGRGAFV